MFCNKCGSENLESVKFCRKCGNPMVVNKKHNSVHSLKKIEKRMIQSKKGVLIATTMVLIFVSGFFLFNGNNPERVVGNLLNAYKNGSDESKYLEKGSPQLKEMMNKRLIEVENTLGMEIDLSLKKMYQEKMKNMKYEIIEVEIGENWAEVNVAITNYDIGKAVKEKIKKAEVPGNQEELVALGITAGITVVDALISGVDEVAERLLRSVLEQKEDDSMKSIRTVNIQVVKEKNRWVVKNLEFENKEFADYICVSNLAKWVEDIEELF